MNELKTSIYICTKILQCKIDDTSHTVVSKQIKTHPANIIDMRLPLFTQFNVWGTYDPSIAEPNTNNGNRDVNLDNNYSFRSLTKNAEYMKGFIKLKE